MVRSFAVRAHGVLASGAAEPRGGGLVDELPAVLVREEAELIESSIVTVCGDQRTTELAAAGVGRSGWSVRGGGDILSAFSSQHLHRTKQLVHERRECSQVMPLHPYLEGRCYGTASEVDCKIMAPSETEH